MLKNRLLSALCSVLLFCAFSNCFAKQDSQPSKPETIELSAKNTLTVLEMNHGDTLKFKLQNGRVFTLKLIDSQASIIQRVTFGDLGLGGAIYQFSLDVEVDGQPMTLQKYVGCQESFYEPYVINGVRIWPDTAKKVFELIPIRLPGKGNMRCRPRKDVRIVLQEASLRICPEQMQPWIENQENRINIENCYEGDDCYLGAFGGKACHIGLDINGELGVELYAPISFDTHTFFNSVAAGQGNNRWRGIRRWENGDVWAIQSHHLIELMAEDKKPLKAGQFYATSAGVAVGAAEHTHFEFKIGTPAKIDIEKPDEEKLRSIAWPIDFSDQSESAQKDPEVLHADPWILFWQIFEDRKKQQGQTLAEMNMFLPGKTGQNIKFSSMTNGHNLQYYWTFGDGCFSKGKNVTHTYSKPGVYPVTLVVDDKVKPATKTQHITISGDEINKPILTLVGEDEVSFGIRRPIVADTYGDPVKNIPHTLTFRMSQTSAKNQSKKIFVKNTGTGQLGQIKVKKVEIKNGNGWIGISQQSSEDVNCLVVKVNAENLKPGDYYAYITVQSQNAINSTQSFNVHLRYSNQPARFAVIVDDADEGFYASPYFWVGHRFFNSHPYSRGVNKFYLTNGWRALDGEFARFTPNIQSGKYDVSFHFKTQFSGDAQFDVRVKHRAGSDIIHIVPKESREIGTFYFEEGLGFVEILAGNSKGLIVADAIKFLPAQ